MAQQPQSDFSPQQLTDLGQVIQRNWDADARVRSSEAQALLTDWREGRVSNEVVSPEYLSRLLDGPLLPEARQQVSQALSDLRAYNSSGDALESDFYNGAMSPVATYKRGEPR